MQKNPAEEHLNVFPCRAFLSINWHVVFKMKAHLLLLLVCTPHPALCAACGRPCSFDSSYGLHETATTLDIPSRWDPRANQSPTGALVAVLRTAALFDSRTGQIKNALAQCAKAFL